MGTDSLVESWGGCDDGYEGCGYVVSVENEEGFWRL